MNTCPKSLSHLKIKKMCLHYNKYILILSFTFSQISIFNDAISKRKKRGSLQVVFSLFRIKFLSAESLWRILNKKIKIKTTWFCFVLFFTIACSPFNKITHPVRFLHWTDYKNLIFLHWQLASVRYSMEWELRFPPLKAIFSNIFPGINISLK